MEVPVNGSLVIQFFLETLVTQLGCSKKSKYADDVINDNINATLQLKCSETDCKPLGE